MCLLKVVVCRLILFGFLIVGVFAVRVPAALVELKPSVAPTAICGNIFVVAEMYDENCGEEWRPAFETVVMPGGRYLRLVHDLDKCDVPPVFSQGILPDSITAALNEDAVKEEGFEPIEEGALYQYSLVSHRNRHPQGVRLLLAFCGDYDCQK